jgi:hypothetical protein
MINFCYGLIIDWINGQRESKIVNEKKVVVYQLKNFISSFNYLKKLIIIDINQMIHRENTILINRISPFLDLDHGLNSKL